MIIRGYKSQLNEDYREEEKHYYCEYQRKKLRQENSRIFSPVTLHSQENVRGERKGERRKKSIEKRIRQANARMANPKMKIEEDEAYEKSKKTKKHFFFVDANQIQFTIT